MRLIRKWGAFLALALLAQTAWGNASHVVVIVWDGMRPDFVSRDTTPTLFNMARDGVTFVRHHPVFVSSTEVNGTALATGVNPAESGIIGNREFRPALDPLKPIDTQALASIRKGDELSGGRYLAFPTVAEILRANHLHTAVAGAKAVALLADRAARPADAPDSVVFEGETLPEALQEKLTAALGKFPATGHNNKVDRDAWTTKALTESLWAGGVPAFSLLWLSEPDYSQHNTGPGSSNALASIKSSDANLARVLAALKEKNVLNQTDVIVVSDHGFSTVTETVDVVAALNQAGLHAFREFPAGGPKAGDILVLNNGGADFLYVTGHDIGVAARATRCLQGLPCAGVCFARFPVEGTFPLADLKLDSPGAPDLVLSMRWKPDASSNGTLGLIFTDSGGTYGAGKGNHGSLSPFDMHNTCVAAGPDFRKDFQDPFPSGNIDIAPTVLWILGVEPNQKMSGRVLREALEKIDPPPALPSVKPRRQDATWRGPDFIWRQHLDTSEVDGVIYFDEGNGFQIPVPH